MIQDGYFDSHGRTLTVILCTECFSVEECIILQQVLLKFHIKSTLKVRNKELGTYRIRLSKTSMPLLREILLSKTPLNFHYKLGVLHTNRTCWAFLKFY
ncbi:hypothetical protein EON69_00075 [bacterium]|nr:MAG: hypothetical protein EON69_00075 [bacterium]